MKKVVAIVLGLLLPVLVQAMPVLSKFYITENSNKIRYNFDFKGDFEFKSFVLRHPNRVIIDFENLKIKAPLNIRSRGNSPVSSIRSAKHNNYFRVVFDTRVKPSFRVFRVNTNSHSTYRLAVEFMAILKSSKKPHHPKKVAKKKSRNVVVVIDPGHGGKDPGAIGTHGTKEKNIVMSIAKLLQSDINHQTGYKAILTRNDDHYMSLRKRLSLAHKYKADMFVAIHADAYRHHRAHGVSVYAVSKRGATSEAARWLAKRENESEFVGGLALHGKDRQVRSVLIDLSQTHAIGVSLQMGAVILKQLSRFATLHHSIVEQAAFVVLKSPDIPSLLVETGFLSNAKEEKKLITKKYQGKIAHAIERGIKQYFVSHPPRGTRVSYNLNKNNTQNT